MRCALEDVLGLLRRHEPADIRDPRLLLYQHQTRKVLRKWHQSRVLLEVRTVGRVLGHFQVVPSVRFHEIVLGSDDYGVALVVGGEAVVDAGEVFAYFDGGVVRLVSVECAVGGEDEQQVAVVAGEVLVAEIVGVLVVEVGPDSHVDVLLEADEEVVEQLALALAVADLQVLVAVAVVDRSLQQGVVDGLGARVVEVEDEVVDLHDHQELFSHSSHPIIMLRMRVIAQQTKIIRRIGSKIAPQSTKIEPFWPLARFDSKAVSFLGVTGIGKRRRIPTVFMRLQFRIVFFLGWRKQLVGVMQWESVLVADGESMFQSYLLGWLL